jgi:hypothetical protein
MNPTELQPIIKKAGILNTDIFNLIAYHNENKGHYTLSEIHSYLKCKIAEYPSTLKSIVITRLYDEIVIKENGEDTNLIIKETIKPNQNEKDINNNSSITSLVNW